MASDRKQVSIQYRRYSESSDALAGATLTSAINQAMSTPRADGKLAEHPRHRHYLPELSFGTVVLNYFREIDTGFFGELVRFEAGAQLSLLKIDHVNENSYNLLQQNAPEGHEAIKGILYFLAINNHVLVLEQDLSTRRLEQYLAWVLSKATDCFPSIASLGVALDTKLHVDGKPIRLTSVSDALIKPAKLSKGTINQDSLSSEDELSVSSFNILNVLKAAGMDSTDVMSLVQQNTDVEVSIHIKFKDARRKTFVAMPKAERLFRNVDGDLLTLNGPGGREQDGKLTRLAHTTDIRKIGALLDPQDVTRALFEAYESFVQHGYIKP